MTHSTSNEQPNRRTFNQLTVAAFSGMLAGVLPGCGGGDQAPQPAPDGEPAPQTGGDASPPDEQGPAAGPDPMLLAQEPHVCRGLNTCEGKGKGGDNACAGQGACATAEAHSCHYENACKGQGGCGELAGQNQCKGQGLCAVPLSPTTWEKTRQVFEEVMARQNKQVGAAPEPAAG